MFRAILLFIILMSNQFAEILDDAATSQLPKDAVFAVFSLTSLQYITFLTPIGHKNNTLVLGPGGYRFGDYWRLGLPLEILVVALSVPMLLWVWPL